MDKWIYIDEFDFSRNYKYISCDTRDFHIIGHEDGEDCKIPSNGNNKFTLEDIKVFLKSIEQETGGKGSWRMLIWKHNPKVNWWKYLRFYRLSDNCYLGYVDVGDTKYAIDRKFCTPDSINKEYLNFIGPED